MISKMVRVAVAAALMLTVAGALPATAKGGDVIERGACSGRSDWKLKLSPDNGRIEVEYQVDSNVRGQHWSVKIFKDGTKIFDGMRQTKGPSGSFTVRDVTSNPAGPDHFLARARNAASGETCVGMATI